MKIRSRLFLVLLVMSLLLSGCGAPAAENATQTEQPTAAATEPAQTQAAATEPAAEEVQASFVDNLHYRPVLSETVLPEKDEATGTMYFYFNDKAIHAGSPVSDLIEIGIHTYADLTTVVQPWHMSEVVRVLVDIPEVDEDDEPYLFFVAMNASDEPCMISECLIYSITVNCEKGIRFGSGNESTAFVSGETKREEIVAAYGEPDESVSNRSYYEEIFYYEPFNSVSFSFQNNVVRQINAYYSANVYGTLAENVAFGDNASAMEKDAYLLMSQYLDVTYYLEKKEETAEDKETGEDDEDKKDTDKTGILPRLNTYFDVNGSRIHTGGLVSKMPNPFRENLEGLTMPVERHHYVRTGRNEPEEFFLINHRGQRNSKSDYLSIKGIVTENRNYCNWGFDNSAFHEFNCQGVTQDSTIDDVLELLGKPRELICSSGERTCFAWMHYETEAGDYLHIRVDPMLNQVIEVQMSRYFEGERSY